MMTQRRSIATLFAGWSLMVVLTLPTTAQAGHGRGGRHVVATGPISYINAPATESYGGFPGQVVYGAPIYSGPAPVAQPATNVRVAPIMPNYNTVPDMGLGYSPVSALLQTQPVRYHHVPVNFYYPISY